MELIDLKRFKLRWFVVFAVISFIGTIILSIFLIDVPGLNEWITLMISLLLLFYILYYSKKFRFTYSEQSLSTALSAKSWGKYLTLTASLQLAAVAGSTFLLTFIFLQFEENIRDFFMFFLMVDDVEVVKLPLIAYILFFINICILAPLWEELLFRGILLRRLALKWSPQKSIIVSSLLFGVIHLSPINFVFAFCLGCVLGYAYLKTKSIIVPMLLHSFSNFLAFIQYIWTNESTSQLLPTTEDAKFTVLVSGIATVLLCLVISVFLIKYFKNFRNFTLQKENSDMPIN